MSQTKNRSSSRSSSGAPRLLAESIYSPPHRDPTITRRQRAQTHDAPRAYQTEHASARKREIVFNVVVTQQLRQTGGNLISIQRNFFHRRMELQPQM